MKVNRFLGVSAILCWFICIWTKQYEWHWIISCIMGGHIGAAFSRLWISEPVIETYSRIMEESAQDYIKRNKEDWGA